MAPVPLVVPLAPVPPVVGVPVVLAGLLMVPPVVEVPVLFMAPEPPAGGLIGPPELSESGIPPTLVAAESVPSVLLGVLVEAPLPPQLPSSKPPSTRAANARPEKEEVIKMKKLGNGVMAYLYGRPLAVAGL